MGSLALALAIETSVHFEPAQNSRVTRALCALHGAVWSMILMDSTRASADHIHIYIYKYREIEREHYMYRKVINKTFSTNF